MGTLNSWDVIDANNNATPPDGWPENTMNYSDVNDTGRAVQGTVKRFFADINGSLDAAGVADAYTLTLNETGYTAYFDGMTFACTIPVDNATATPTIDVNGIGPVTIVDNLGNQLGIEALIGGGVYTFQYDGTNMRLVTGGIAVNGSTGEFLINQDGRIDAPGNLTYDSGDDIVISDPSLRVAEWLEMNEQAALNVGGGAVAGRGYLWVRNDSPSVLIFTDDTGADTILGAGGGGSAAGPTDSIQYNAGGGFGGNAAFSFDANAITTGQILLSPVGSLTTGNLLEISANAAAFDGNLIDLLNDNIGSTGYCLNIVGSAGAGAVFIEQQTNFPAIEIDQTLNVGLLINASGGANSGIEVNMGSGGFAIDATGPASSATSTINAVVQSTAFGDAAGVRIDLGAAAGNNDRYHLYLRPHPDNFGQESNFNGLPGNFYVDDNSAGGFLWQKLAQAFGTNDWSSYCYEKQFNRVLTNAGTETQYDLIANLNNSWTEIIIWFNEISTDGSSPIRIVCGPSGTPVLTGYQGRTTGFDAANTASSDSNLGGHHLYSDTFAAGNTVSGVLRITRADLSEYVNFEWQGYDSSGNNIFGFTWIDITGNVDIFRMTTDGGTDVFDGGEYTVLARMSGRASNSDTP